MSIISEFKEISSVLKKIGNLELYQKILDLQSKVMDLNSENETLKRKNEELTELVNIKNKMHFKSPFYYMDCDEVPCCPRCWENDKKEIHLYQELAGKYDCPQCAFSYDNEKQRGGISSIQTYR